MRPGAPPKPCRYVYTGPGEVSWLITNPPGTSVIPCFNKIQCIKVSRQRSFTSIQTFHADRQTDKQTDRQTDKHTHAHTHIYIYISKRWYKRLHLYDKVCLDVQAKKSKHKQIKFVLKCLDISWQLLLLKQMSLFTVSFWVPWGFKGSMNECMLQVDWMKIHALSVRTLIFSVSWFAWVYTWSCSYSTLLVLYMSSIIFTCVILLLEESVWFTYCTPVF